LGWKWVKNRQETLRFSQILVPKYWTLNILIVLNNIEHGTLGGEELVQLLPHNSKAEFQIISRS